MVISNNACTCIVNSNTCTIPKHPVDKPHLLSCHLTCYALFCFNLFLRALPQTFQTGSASSQFVQKFPSCRESDEILQLYTCVKPQTSSHLHASNVVSQE